MILAQRKYKNTLTPMLERKARSHSPAGEGEARLAVQRNPLGYFGRLGRTIPRARFKVRARGSQGGHVSDIAEASADRTATTSAQYKCAESRSDSPSPSAGRSAVNCHPAHREMCKRTLRV